MESTPPPCTLNPDAHTLIFKHARVSHPVFSDVIGLHDIDHISLTTISRQNELTILSYRPAVEFDLIKTDLWHHDRSYHPDFFKTRQCKLWTDLYNHDRYTELMHVKQTSKHLRAGISTTVAYSNCILLLSFATQSKHPEAGKRLLEAHPDLIKMGRYCFQKISHLFLPYLGKTTAQKKSRIFSPYMQLVVNNNVTERGVS
ncbi:MAG: hypothetical protein GW760_02730 [Legionella sp.]|jgi:hypothetical protein|nr:hypothetical protein [Legionella sp.]